MKKKLKRDLVVRYAEALSRAYLSVFDKDWEFYDELGIDASELEDDDKLSAFFYAICSGVPVHVVNECSFGDDLDCDSYLDFLKFLTDEYREVHDED